MTCQVNSIERNNFLIAGTVNFTKIRRAQYFGVIGGGSFW